MRRVVVLTLLLVSVLISQHSNAQLNEADYRKQAEEVRKYVWGLNIKAFGERNVPAEYAKYSKVVLAKYEEVTGLTKSKIKWIGFGLLPLRDLTYTHTTRELVKINDAAALEEYSEISFQKFAQRYNNKLTTFLGVRVIKADGTMKEINPDEIILTNNTNKDKKGKLAVSELQIGDMLDYFIQTVEFYNGGSTLDFENFVFADENPIMHYSVHVEASKKLSVEFRAMNGAPDFKETRNEENDIILDAEKTNIPPFPSNLWTSAYRQTPLLRFHMVMGYKGLGANYMNARKPGIIYKNLDAEEVVEDYKATLKNYVVSLRHEVEIYDNKLKKIAQSYLEANGGGKVKDNSTALYYATRHHFFLEPNKETIAAVDKKRNYSSPSDMVFLALLEALFKEFGIGSKFVLIPSKYGPKAAEVMSMSDLSLALLTEDNHIFTAISVFDSPDVIPYYLEGQQATTLDFHLGLGNSKAEQGSYSTNYTPAAKNVHTEDLVYYFDPANPQKIQVDRKANITGLLRLDYQQQLSLFEDFYEEERKGMGIEESFYDELKDSRKGKKIVEEYEHAFEEARKQWKENFKAEIEDQFNVKPEELLGCKIEQSGIFETKPAFKFNTQFTVNAWVKKAGNNFILDAGKMIGEQLKIKTDQRDRKVDIYMPNARTSQFNMSIPVPKGYTAEGLEKLNTSLDNSTGSFITTAKMEGSNVKITVTKVYKNAFEKAEKWPELLKMLDAAAAFEEAKIMFRKS
jgi:hypothetical protein